MNNNYKKMLPIAVYYILNLAVLGFTASLVNDWIGKKYWAMSFALILLIITAPFLGKKVGEFINKYLTIPILLVFPLVCYYVSEKTMDTGYSLIGKTKAFVGNYGLYAMLVWLAFSLTLSLGIAVFVGAASSIFFGMSNYFVIMFRQIPILAGDVATVGTALNVADSYEYVLSIRQFVGIAFVLASLSFLLFYKKEKQKTKTQLRLIIACVYLILFCSASYTMLKTDFLKNHGISINTFMPIKSYRNNGGLLTFVRSIRTMMVDKPEGYNVDSIVELMDKYSSDSVSTDTDKTRPNVIVIMNEAFADLQDVGELHTNTEVMPFYDSLEENTIKGRSYVSVFGGQTANTEYEFLTGDSKAFLPAGTTPYQLYIKSFIPSLTQNMILDNYSGILALHPFNASGYNRQNVYPYMGFSRFITNADFSEDLLEQIGTHVSVSDKVDYDRVIEEYENAKAESDEPFYIFNVTMQNHSPYDEGWDGMEDAIDILDENLNMPAVENYLNMIHESDKALEYLVSYFEDKEEPTVIVFFGDHEPGLSDEFYNELLGEDKDNLTGKEAFNLYHTKFLIWANYDIPEEKYVFEDGISINYLQSVMLDVTGMKMAGYNKYLLDLMKDVPIINANGYIGADGEYYTVDDKTSPYYNEVNMYNTITYNHLFDKNNRVDSFFEYAK